MVRKLKYHEQKLLKKVDFISWQSDNNLHEVKILRKYHIQKREDYTKLAVTFDSHTADTSKSSLTYDFHFEL